MNQALTCIVAEHIRAINAFDIEAIVATFATDAYVNDNRREIVGIKAIRRWVEREMVGDHVTIAFAKCWITMATRLCAAPTTVPTTRRICPKS